ncbi:MAG: methionine biosynthesis protein MetW [Oligosphaeraceae bacterium]|nr:methionine biosynthesis protein MetW [Oligosphaeraceae bacterium]
MSIELEQFNNIAPGLLKGLNELGIEADPASLRRLFERADQLQYRHREIAKAVTTRWQDSVIAGMVPLGSSVLDIGCGDGDLLLRLANERQAFVQGVERDQEAVIRCIERGLPICHSDLEKGLGSFQDLSFDYVILQNTVQTLYRALDVLRETLRIGRFAVISFPNFAHWLVRMVFSLGGRMPVTPALPYDWHNTPNIHLCSIEDFLDWCRDDRVRILSSWVLVEGKVLEYEPEHNLSAEEAVFLVKAAEEKK